MWKEIKDFPNYSISDTGEIKNNKRDKKLSIAYNQDGYAIVQLWKNNKGYMRRVHRLVLETFLPIENSENYEVNHKDCNIKNNSLDNLEWCTSKENTDYRLSLGHTRGRKVQVKYLTGEIEIYSSILECARHFNVDQKAIQHYIENKLTKRRKIQAEFTYV